MNLLNKIKKPALLLATALLAAACTDVEDYPDGRISREDVFQNAKRTAGWLNRCYSFVGNNRLDILEDNSFLASCTDEAHDVLDLRNGAPYIWNAGNASAFSNPLERSDTYWSYYYQGIRYCNVFIDEIDEATVFQATDRPDFRAQAYGLRAYFYLQLIKRYGGVPIVLKEITDNSEYATLTRNTFAECVRQIISDCRVVLEDDNTLTYFSGTSTNNRYRMSRGMAYAIMSEAALYAASPLYNDGTFTWEEAAEITKEALDQCLANGYALYTTTPTGNEGYYAYDTYFVSRSDVIGVSDKETIMEAPNQLSMWSYNGLPTITGQTKAGTCPSQELVDSYETIDGVMPILGYSDDDHLKPIINPEATLYSESDPYANRDPRLKASVYYNGVTTTVGGSTIVNTAEGGNCAISSSSIRYTRTGYYIRKFGSPNSDRTSNQDGYYKIFRLAELYLNYAEAACEAASGTVPDAAVDAVNAVRSRAGMPSLSYGMTKDDFRTRVRNERRVEFAFEEQRFYDVRRWKILSETDRVVTGMRPTESGYERFVVDRRVSYTDKYLFNPIPGDEVIRYKNYTGTDFQNAGW